LFKKWLKKAGIMTRKVRLLFESISILCLIVFLSVNLSGCAATRHTVQRTVVPLLDTSVDDLVDKLLRQKNGAFVKEGIPGALLVITGLTEMAPTNYNLLATTSFLYAAYGLFVEDENNDYAISLYRVGTDYGMRALMVNNSRFRKAVESGTPVYEAVKFLTKDDLKALTWYGLNLAKRCTLQLATVEELTDIQDGIAMIKRSIELDPKYAWGAPWMAMGIVYAVLPAYCDLGGGADTSRDAFANANKAEKGEFGLVDMFTARYLGPLLRDREGYYKLNNRVIEMDPCKLGGGMCVVNELAKQKARYNMEHEARWFSY
jgi:hypothetical protein